MKVSIIFVFLTVLFAYEVSAQDIEITPLHKFLQTNFDSSIIYYPVQAFGPQFFIVAKKDQGVYYFTYLNPYVITRGRSYPGGLIRKFWKESDKFSRTSPDTNNYFLPANIHSSLQKDFWKEVNTTDIWDLKDDRDTSVKHPHGWEEDYSNPSSVTTYYLITSNHIKSLYYWMYDLENVNMVKEMEVAKLFRERFPDPNKSNLPIGRSAIRTSE